MVELVMHCLLVFMQEYCSAQKEKQKDFELFLKQWILIWKVCVIVFQKFDFVLCQAKTG